MLAIILKSLVEQQRDADDSNGPQGGWQVRRKFVTRQISTYIETTQGKKRIKEK
jgi:hypothetical protein